MHKNLYRRYVAWTRLQKMAVPKVLREVEGMAKAYLTRKRPRISLSGFVCVSDDGICRRRWGVGRGMREFVHRDIEVYMIDL